MASSLFASCFFNLYHCLYFTTLGIDNKEIYCFYACLAQNALFFKGFPVKESVQKTLQIGSILLYFKYQMIFLWKTLRKVRPF
ncbi:MAG: hypothetical protein A3G11_01835 [Candidatus Lloydbacteria bacterium RIFCSPLOWO2_12_FULL_51_9]|uniref:Uncharacterized protein n=2 Tax=Candidatus Lloydiibacteriota TaxID=1817910 RepID=A0A1G2DUR3_9BACT|nr:MAG: hypothetical protein A3J08_04010 [Candidatus Lloydbacteria bacterium RIFCSPLOWO2_02_FULL_51_11]OGZ17293.1 MAG: hypothetical protein A3G11_01835 [Candidatus Lloydbacteria bacterium RIFCSPLOWO2_12_FULL_51_9]